MEGQITISSATIVWAATAFCAFFGREVLKYLFEKLVMMRPNGNGSASMLAMKELIRETVDQSVATQLETSVLPILKNQAEVVHRLTTVAEQIKDTLVKLTTIADERRPLVEYVAAPRRRRKK